MPTALQIWQRWRDEHVAAACRPPQPAHRGAAVVATARCNLACPYCCPDVEEPLACSPLSSRSRDSCGHAPGGTDVAAHRWRAVVEPAFVAFAGGGGAGRRDRSDPMPVCRPWRSPATGCCCRNRWRGRCVPQGWIASPSAWMRRREQRRAWLVSRVVPWLETAWCARCRTASRRPAPLADPHAVSSTQCRDPTGINDDQLLPWPWRGSRGWSCV